MSTASLIQRASTPADTDSQPAESPSATAATVPAALLNEDTSSLQPDNAADVADPTVLFTASSAGAALEQPAPDSTDAQPGRAAELEPAPALESPAPVAAAESPVDVITALPTTEDSPILPEPDSSAQSVNPSSRPQKTIDVNHLRRLVQKPPWLKMPQRLRDDVPEASLEASQWWGMPMLQGAHQSAGPDHAGDAAFPANENTMTAAAAATADDGAETKLQGQDHSAQQFQSASAAQHQHGSPAAAGSGGQTAPVGMAAAGDSTPDRDSDRSRKLQYVTVPGAAVEPLSMATANADQDDMGLWRWDCAEGAAEHGNTLHNVYSTWSKAQVCHLGCALTLMI